jgi:site-specific recombinase XerD
MFERYFCPRVVTRLRAGPDAEWLESFLLHLHRCGHARLTVQTYVRQAELFAGWLRRRRRDIAAVTDDDVRAFGHHRPSKCRWSALGKLLTHLRGVRVVPLPPVPDADPVDRVIGEYDTHLRDAAGLADATRLYYRRYADEFLRSACDTGPIRWTRLRPEHVRAFIAGYGADGRLAAAAVAAGAIRRFLRWLEFRGRVDPALVAAVPAVRRWRHAGFPQPLTDDQYRAVLATCDRSTPTGRRDYAMLVCMGDLGLRCGEVAALTLGDLDTTVGTLRIAAGKSRRARVLPLPDRVRKAVATYVRRDRPPTGEPRLFLRDRFPAGGGVTKHIVRQAARRAFARVPGCERQTGTHILRHTAATRLHRAGADLKRVADILGHRSLDTTAGYAKVDRARLDAVARPWPTAPEVRP